MTRRISSAKEILRTEIRYLAWADRQVLDACSALPAEELERNLKHSHASLLGTLRHIYDGERVWLECLQTNPEQGRWVLPQGDLPEPSFDSLWQNWPALWDGYRNWLEVLPEEELEVELAVLLPGEVEPKFPRWKILRHVLNHSTLHRGQVVSMIRALGRQPPQTDLLSYYFVG